MSGRWRCTPRAWLHFGAARAADRPLEEPVGYLYRIVRNLARSRSRFALLALSQDRHWHHLGATRHCPRRTAIVLRVAGGALLMASLVLALLSDGPSFGSLLWGTTLSVCGFAVACTLTLAGHKVLPPDR
jgi:hypothetical protein